MKLIIISGPSGSGKTTLSKQIKKELKDVMILNTDNYYRSGLISRILSKIVSSYFDRTISFNFKIFEKHLDFIIKNGFSDYNYKYNFKGKSLKKIYKKRKNIKFIIIEGIFGKEALIKKSLKNCILINLKTSKKTCLKRVIKRDVKERSKSENNARKDFLNAWNLFHKNKNKIKSSNYLKKIIITNKADINLLIKKIINITN